MTDATVVNTKQCDWPNQTFIIIIVIIIIITVI